MELAAVVPDDFRTHTAGARTLLRKPAIGLSNGACRQPTCLSLIAWRWARREESLDQTTLITRPLAAACFDATLGESKAALGICSCDALDEFRRDRQRGRYVPERFAVTYGEERSAFPTTAARTCVRHYRALGPTAIPPG